MLHDNVNAFLRRTAELFSVSETTVVVAAILMAALAAFSVGVLVQVMMISRDRKLSWRSAFSYAVSSAWAIPVLAVTAFFAYRVFETYQRSEPPPPSHVNRKGDVSVAFVPIEQAGRKTPNWIGDVGSPIRDPQTKELKQVVVSARGADTEDAERRLTRKVQKLYAKEFPEENGTLNPAALSTERIKSHLLAEEPFEQPGVEQVGEYTNNVTEVYWRLDFSPEARQSLREAAVAPRIWTLVGGLVLLGAIVIGVTLYLRLDAATAGRYRLRLKLATTSLIVAVGLAVTALLPTG